MSGRDRARAERLMNEWSMDQFKRFCRSYSVKWLLTPNSKEGYIRAIFDSIQMAGVMGDGPCLDDVFQFAKDEGIEEPKPASKSDRDGGNAGSGNTYIHNEFHDKFTGQFGQGRKVAQNQTNSVSVDEELAEQLQLLRGEIEKLKLEPHRKKRMLQNVDFIENETAMPEPDPDLLDAVVEETGKLAKISKNSLAVGKALAGVWTILKSLFGL